jgi:GT2 family glycosyltransferase
MELSPVPRIHPFVKLLPLVSIIILNYKRREAFVRSLESARKQSYVNCEIIVVDNNSEDGVREFLEGQAPEVKLIELSENRGACGGRNAGILSARGDIIITLDNDIFFDGPLEVSRTVETFARRPDVHVLAFKLCDEQTGALRIREWCHPKSWAEYSELEFETDHFVEGACAARREVYDTAGLYYEPLFFGAEGWDLVLRIIDANFRILYEPKVRVCHLMAAETRSNERPYYFYTRNYIWTAYKDYPLLAGIAYVGMKLLMMLYFAIRTGHIVAFLRGMKDGFFGFRSVLRDRTPVRRLTLQRIRDLERSRPSVWVRLGRHRGAVQL